MPVLHLCLATLALASPGLADSGSGLGVARRRAEAGRRRHSGLKYVVPKLGQTVFDVTDLGAKGDNKTLDTDAIQESLWACGNSSDGGVVRLPAPGVYLSDYLRADNLEHCSLQVEAGATLFAHFAGRWDGDAFLTFLNTQHFSIQGGGVINANGWHWWPQTKNRPHTLHIGKANTVALHDVTFLDGAAHMLELYANNTEVSNVDIKINWGWWYGNKVDGLATSVTGDVAPNTDGIDVHGTPFYIHDCHIDVGDDNIAIHESDVLIEDCIFGGEGVGVHGHGVSIGSVGSGCFHQNITVRNSRFLNTHVGPNIKINSDASEGYVRNVLYENLIIEGTQKENLRLNTGRDSSSASLWNAKSGFIVDNITYRNITVTNTTDHYVTFVCTKAIPCTNIHLEDVIMDADSHRDVQCSYASGTMRNVSPKLCLDTSSSLTTMI